MGGACCADDNQETVPRRWDIQFRSWRACMKTKRHVPWKGSPGEIRGNLDFDVLEQKYTGKNVPRIVEIGLYINSQIQGIYIAYADGTTFEAMGDGIHEDCSETIFKSIILRKGEYINKILAYGVEQAWFNMLCIYTNQGRSLVAGVAEGGFLHEIPEGSIVLGF